VVGVRVSGGVGPVRVSVPVGGSLTGFFGLCVKSLWWGGVLVWWMLYFGCWWPCRLLFFDLPRAGCRAYQRRQERLGR